MPTTRLVNPTLRLSFWYWLSGIESLTLSLWHWVSDIESLTLSLRHWLTLTWQIGVYQHLQDACWKPSRSPGTYTGHEDEWWSCPYHAKTHLMLTERSHPNGHHHHTQESPTKPRWKVKDRNEPHCKAKNRVKPRAKDQDHISSFIRP